MLSEDQKQKIEANKAAAALKRASKLNRDLETSLEKDCKRCSDCGCAEILPLYLEVFEENVCKRCASKNDDWQLINKTTVSTEYLLTEDCVQHMKHKTKDNPHRKGWSEMKLYLRLHARLEGERRWGSSNELQEEKNKRERSKLDREMAKARESSMISTQLQQQNYDNDNDDGNGNVYGGSLEMDSSNILADMLEGGGNNVLYIANSLHNSKDNDGNNGNNGNVDVNEVHSNSSKSKRKLEAYPAYQAEKQSFSSSYTATSSNSASNNNVNNLSPREKGGGKKRKTAAVGGRLAGMLSAIRGSSGSGSGSGGSGGVAK
jgi:DNA repair protein